MMVHISILIAVSLLLLAAAGDVVRRIVPNWLSLALATDGLLLRALGGNLLFAIAAALLVFMPAVWCWRRGLMGGGDVKLLAAASLLVSPSLVPGYVLVVGLAGGILGLAYCAMRLVLRRPSPIRPRALVARILRIEQHRISRGFSLPYASAIAAGGVYSLLKG
jgi:prepilin peptidase CpaA